MTRKIGLVLDVWDRNERTMVLRQVSGDTLEEAIAAARRDIAEQERLANRVCYVMLENVDLLPYIRNKDE